MKTISRAMIVFSRESRGFSLVEVILALGLFVFCIVALLNLLTVGIQATGQTEQRLGAANTAQSLLEMRRLYPVNPTNAAASPVDLADWGIPELSAAQLTQAGTNGITASNVISEEGRIVPETSPDATYRLVYRIALPVFTTAAGVGNSNCVNIHLHLAPFHSVGRLRAYELASSITIP